VSGRSPLRPAPCRSVLAAPLGRGSGETPGTATGGRAGGESAVWTVGEGKRRFKAAGRLFALRCPRRCLESEQGRWRRS